MISTSKEQIPLGVISYHTAQLGASFTDFREKYPDLPLRAEYTNPQPVALIGRVAVKVSTENGSIQIGDRITTGSLRGRAMKATQDGHVLGTALDSFDGSNSTTTATVNGQEVKLGRVLVYIDLGWQKLTAENGTDPELASSEITLESLATKQDELEARVSALELKLDDGGSLTTSTTTDGSTSLTAGVGGLTPTDSAGFLASLKNAFASLGATLQDGILEVKGLISDRVVTKELQMIDKATGEIYCSWIENGEWVKQKGECNEQATAGDSNETPPTELPTTEGAGQNATTTTEGSSTSDVSQTATSTTTTTDGGTSTTNDDLISSSTTATTTDVEISTSQNSTTTDAGENATTTGA